MDLIIIITCLIICYCTGNAIEKKHYNNIKERELRLYKSPCISYGKIENLNTNNINNSHLVSSSVVIGCDYFKLFLAKLRNIFGGNVSAYESVLDRGRREAVLRMRELAVASNASEVINVKIDTVILNSLHSNSKINPKVCITAYGTAIEYDK